MLSISNVSSRQAQNYYAADDYYTEGHPAGFWYGRGCEALKLGGVVEPEQLNRLLDGELPTGDRIHQGGGPRRAATDFTFSAPKSVSIQALIGGDARLLKAQETAVKEALDYGERFIGLRVTQMGKTRFQLTNSAVFAVIQHDTSRAGDPNIHHHCLLLNCTQRADKEWRAFENRKLVEQKTVLDAIYTAKLQQECRLLGYEVRQTETSFELGHISREQIMHFSKRAQAIEDGLAERGLDRRTATTGERQLVTLQSREKKERYDREVLKQEWQEQGKKVDLHLDIPELSTISKNQSPESPVLMARENTENKKEDKVYTFHYRQVKVEVEFVIERLAEREASFGKHHVMVEVLRQGQGGIEAKQIERVLENMQQKGEIVLSSDGKYLATAKAMGYERRILEIEKTGRGQVQAIGWKAWFEKEAEVTEKKDIKAKGTPLDIPLNAEQEKALMMVLETTNRIIGIQGYAGTGKTTTLKVLQDACKAEGYDFIGLAPSHSAVKALGESGISGQTLQRWISDRQARDGLSSKSILLIDEAGLVSAKQMKVALERAAYQDARVILVGDVKQYQGVEAGKPFAQLQKEGMETATIQKMLRQKEAGLAAAAQLSIASPQEALKKLKVVEEKDKQKRYQQIAKDFVGGGQDPINTSQAQGQGKGKGQEQERQKDLIEDSLILCGTNQAREQINREVRKELGLLGQGESYRVFTVKDLTGAEKKRLSSYEIGYVLRFEKEYPSLGIKKGEYFAVKEVAQTHLVLQVDRSDKTMKFLPLNISDRGFTVGRVESCEIAAGEWVKFTTTKKEGGSTYTNGERAWVESVNKEGMVLNTVTGKKILMDSKEIAPLDYAYATTGHSAQGLGAKRVLMEKDSGSITTNQRSFYTDLTRAKEEVRLYTNDAKALPVAINRQVEKTAALEVSRYNREL